MNKLSAKDLELAKKHALAVAKNGMGFYAQPIVPFYIYTEDELAALFAERDAEQQPNAEAVVEITKHGEHVGINVLADLSRFPAGTKLFTHAPSQGIPEVLFDGYKVYQELTKAEEKRTSYENVSDVLDAVVRILRRSNPAQDTKL